MGLGKVVNTFRIRNVWILDWCHSKLIDSFVIVSHFHWLGQTRQLTVQYVHYESAM